MGGLTEILLLLVDYAEVKIGGGPYDCVIQQVADADLHCCPITYVGVFKLT